MLVFLSFDFSRTALVKKNMRNAFDTTKLFFRTLLYNICHLYEIIHIMYYIYFFNIISIFGSYITSKYEKEFLSIIFNGHADLYFYRSFNLWSLLRATGTFGMLRKLNHKLKFICFASGNEHVAASVMRRRVKRMIKRVDRIRWELNWISSVLSHTIRFYASRRNILQ